MNNEEEITTAEDAINKASRFLRQYFGFILPVEATEKAGVWTVTINVGVFKPNIATLKIDAKNGKIVEYRRPVE